jgi:hypothetical protein
MEPTIRGVGTTRTERTIARLADRTFLDLWSYPNTFNDRDIRVGQGKELCDLLVVCGNDLLIFSDKDIRWPSGDIKRAWSRWYRRAVQHSVEQIKGAERWIRRHPDRIFIDAKCRTRLPVDLPAPEAMTVHGIAVVSGARDACRAYTRDQDGTLMLTSFLAGADHEDPQAKRLPPFMLGDANPDGTFVHVMDMESLTIVMRELDTISDFVAYLKERADALRGKRVRFAASEADLLASYLTSADDDGRPHIPEVSFGLAYPDDAGTYPVGHYAALRKSTAYRARLEFNKDSLDWDRLIGLFSKNLLAGTSVTVAGVEPELRLAEKALRRMALERRVVRRSLAYALRDAYFKAEKVNQDRFVRLIMPPEGAADPECLYLFIILAFRATWLVNQGYTYYRDSRGAMLQAYCQVALLDNPGAKRIVGIALDASYKMTKRAASSEDIMLMETPEWTDELVAETRQIQAKAEILLPSKLKPAFLRQKSTDELRDDKLYSGNRAERRSARAKGKRRGR